MHTRATGLTLVETLVTSVLVATLLALLVPALGRVLEAADQAACASNLRQLGLATQAYLKDHDGWFFPLRTTESAGTLWYFGFEPKGSASRGEGSRTLDRTRGKLYPYLGEAHATVEVCPAFRYTGAYKPKYDDRWWTYGVNYDLVTGTPGRGRNLAEVRPRDLGRTVVFADAAQVNTFQAPASPSNPLVEEWFYVQAAARYVQFRHGGLANVLMADGHVEALPPAAGSYHPLLPQARIGHLDPSRVLFRPQGGR